MKNVWCAVMAVGLAISLAACVSVAKMGFEEMTGEKADIEVIKPMTADLKTYKAIEVEIFRSDLGELVPTALVDGLAPQVVADLKKRGLFQIVGRATEEKPTEPTLLVSGVVTDYKKPDTGAKRLVSKAALFSVRVTVKDKGSGQEIGQAIARGRLQTMFRGDETTLMQKAAESVANYINEAHTPTPGKMEKIKGMMPGKKS